MSDRAAVPGWVQHPDKPRHWELFWLDRSGKPVKSTSVTWEGDEPNDSATGCAAVVLSLSPEVQQSRMWPKGP
jgi:hypothetical protein